MVGLLLRHYVRFIFFLLLIFIKMMMIFVKMMLIFFHGHWDRDRYLFDHCFRVEMCMVLDRDMNTNSGKEFGNINLILSNVVGHANLECSPGLGKLDTTSEESNTATMTSQN